MPIKNCLDCGAEFYTPTTSVRCEACRAVHQKKQAQAHNKRYSKKWMAVPENKERHAEKCKEHYRANREYYKEYQKRYYQEKLKAKRRLNGLPRVTVEVDGQKITLFQCAKLRISAKHLPCGDKWQCWEEPKCVCIPKGKTPVTFEDAVLSPAFNAPYLSVNK